MDVLRIYRDRDVVENCFDDLKNQPDMKRLRVHTSEAMDSRIFLQFLATIFINRIRDISKHHAIIKNLTVREIMEDLETVVKITYAKRYKPLYTETNRIQKKIIEAFGINQPT
jgi:transposase